MGKNNTTFTKTLNMLNIVGLRESINALMKKESKYAPVATVCKSYLKKLDEGLHEEEICEDFVAELAKVAVHESAKDALYAVSTRINENKRDLNIVNSLYSMQKGQYGYIVPMVESSIVEYMTNKNPETRTAARQTLSLFEGIKEVNDIFESLSFDEYEEKTNKQLHNSSLNESMIPQEEKTYTQAEVDEIIASEKEKAIKESTTVEHKKLADIDTHINLDATIKSLMKNSTNEGLKAFCEQYINALNMGKAEETLYEGFISGISKWNYLSAVDTEMSALKDRISKYQQDIDLKKILKIMEGTGSYYIVPLIEGVVADYMENKTMSNKSVLKQRLQAFEYDPFVRDILNIVMLDQSIANTVYLGESVEKLNNYVHTEKVFSPVQYVKENECIFNVKGTYYNRKGNAITKLSKQSIDNLDESFKTLCNLINHPAVKIDELANTISIYEGKDSAKISETAITLNGEEKTTAEIDKIANMSYLMNEHKEGFYAAIKMINENFDKIAYIDFVKRVAMNESNGKTADVFRIKNNIFVTTSNAALGTSTFYRNANPIQCRNYINEHMGINVAPLFEDILPNQKAILEGIEDTKKSYENYLDELNNQKAEFEKMKDTSDDDIKEIDDAIKVIEDEIADVQKKYEEFQKDSEKFTSGDDADADKEDPEADAAATDDTDNKDNAETPDEAPAETPAEMTAPISNDPEATGEDVYVDPDQEAIDSATPYDADFDVVAGGNNEKAEVKVLRISYSENVKTGKKSNKGTAYLVIPSVDANGDIKDETKTVTFYLDANRKPVINNDYMPLMVYNSIVNAIADDPDTAAIDVEGTAETPEAPADGVATATIDVTTTELPAPEPEEPVAEPAAEEPVAPEGDDFGEPIASDVPAEEPTAPEDEPTFGVDAPEGEDVDSAIDNLPSPDAAETEAPSNDELDSVLGTEDNAEDDIPSGDAIDFDNTSDNAEDNETPVAPAAEETPAETEERSENPEYPIELGLNLNDIKPITKESFCNACKEMCVECAVVEGEDDSVTLKFANKAAVYALKDYFKEWKNFSDSQFITFFPELKKCFANQPKVPVAPAKANESVSIIGVEAINESKLYEDNHKGCVKIVLPMTESYCKLFSIPMKKNNSHIEIETESKQETAELYEKLSAYSASMNGEIDEDAKAFLERYKDDFTELNENEVHVVNVPYNNFLEQKLGSKGIQVARVDENLNIALHKSDYKKAKKVFESVYGDAAPVEVRDFFQLAEETMNEGVKIRIEDTKTGKVVELNTDDDNNSNDNSSSDKEPETADPFKDVNTTFHASDSALFASDVDSSDEGKEKEKNEEASEESNEEQSTEENQEEQTEETNSEETKKEEPKKKKFKFKPKHKNESVEVKSTQKALNEAEEVPVPDTHAAKPEKQEETGLKKPNLMDWVYIEGGQKGQIIGKLPMSDNFIVNVNGHTIIASPKSVKMVTEKPDTLPAPYKFDPTTLKALFEQFVHCGVFINENQITPNNCFVKYSDFINAKNDEDITIVIDGQRTIANKKYIRIMEEINDFANVNEYVEGVEVTSTGAELRNILFNISDYSQATGTNDTVRVLVPDENNEQVLIYLPAGAIKPIEM